MLKRFTRAVLSSGEREGGYRTSATRMTHAMEEWRGEILPPPGDGWLGTLIPV